MQQVPQFSHSDTPLDTKAEASIIPFPTEIAALLEGDGQLSLDIAHAYEEELKVYDEKMHVTLVRNGVRKILDSPRTLEFLKAVGPVGYKVLLAWSNLMIAYAHRNKKTESELPTS